MIKSMEVSNSRDKDGFLKCNECPRRFLTKVVFEKHSSNQHKTNSETKVDEPAESAAIKDEISLQEDIFESKIDLQLHTSNEHHKVECNECKMLFSYRVNLKKHVQNSHNDYLKVCHECKKSSGYKSNLQKQISTLNKKEIYFQCQECKKTFRQYRP